MKKLTSWLALFAAALLLAPGSTFAASTFTITSFPDSLTAVIGDQFKTTFEFVYSGSSSGLHASIAGSDVPAGISLGNITSGATNSYSIDYSGVPKKGGYYTLTLILTDGQGAEFSKSFTLSVSGFAFRDEAYLNAISGSLYSATIHYDYAGSARPHIHFYDIPDSFQVSYTDLYGENGGFLLRFTPRKTGTFTLKGDLDINGERLITGKTFTFTVVELPKYGTPTATPISQPKTSPVSAPTVKTKTTSQSVTPAPTEEPETEMATSTGSSTEETAPTEGFFLRLWHWFIGLFS